MAGFTGGSAYSMARDIGEGYVAVSERTLRSMQSGDLSKLSHELERLLRELRGTVPEDDLKLLQARQRKIQRLNSAMLVVRSFRLKTRR
jgi:hypothetical protein